MASPQPEQSWPSRTGSRARRLTAELDRPPVVAIAGHGGSGKSTVALRLAADLDPPRRPIPMVERDACLVMTTEHRCSGHAAHGIGFLGGQNRAVSDRRSLRRPRLLVGWQAVTLAVFTLPWLGSALASISGLVDPNLMEPEDTPGDAIVVALLCLAAAAVLVVIMTRTVVILRDSGLWIGGKVVPYDQLIAVEVVADDTWVLPLEVPSLQLVGSQRTRTTTLRELAGVRWPHGNRRVARYANAIRNAAGL